MQLQRNCTILILCFLLYAQTTVGQKDLTTSLCEDTLRPTAAALKAAQQLPQRTALSKASDEATSVQSWEQLVKAVEEYDGSASPWIVFELQSAGPVVATSTLRLRPGMAVVAKQQSGKSARLDVSCQDGLATAFEVLLEDTSSLATAGGSVLLQGLHISGCSGSAVLVSGQLSAAQSRLGQLPAGLHIVDVSFTGNAAKAGGGIRAIKAAVYLDSVVLQGNTASHFGGAVSINQGLLVAVKSTFENNTAGSQGKAVSKDEGFGAAVYANSSTATLINSTITRNTANALGGCAVKAAQSRGVVLSGCKFESNVCQGDATAVAAENFGTSSCSIGGASLMVESGMRPPKHEQPPQCNLLSKHLVHVSDSSFTADQPLKAACGGSVMVVASWLELDGTSWSKTGGAIKGGAVAALDSVVFIKDSEFTQHLTDFNGGAVSTLRSILWAVGSNFTNITMRGSGGGCVSTVDPRMTFVADCTFDRCSAGESGGAFYCQDTFDKGPKPPPATVLRTKFTRNVAYREGGAVSFNSVKVRLIDTVMDSNEGYYGGVVHSPNTLMTVSRARFTNNVGFVGGQGGVFYSTDSPEGNFTDCLFRNNSGYQGSALYITTAGAAAQWIFTRCNFSANTAEQRAGSIFATGTNISFVESNFVNNTALTGPVIYATDGGPNSRPVNVTFSDCTLERNHALQSGGAVWLGWVKYINIQDCMFRHNRADQSGGSIYLQDASAKLSGCVFEENSARLGAGFVLNGKDAVVQAANCRMEGNQASDQAGGGLLMAGSSLTLSKTTFTNNTASTAGGALMVLDDAKLACSSSCTFAGNSAGLGGAIAVQSAALSLTNATLTSNHAPGDLVAVSFGNTQHRAGSGGAIFASNGTLQLKSSSFKQNAADVQGGALQLMSSSLDAFDSTFTGNKAAADSPTSRDAAGTAAIQQRPTAGGAVLLGLLPSDARVNTTAQLKMRRCSLSRNSASFGGGIAAINSQAGLVAPAPSAVSTAANASSFAAQLIINLNDTSLANNSASVAGGGLFTNLPGADISISGSKVTANAAGQGGGGLAAVTPASFKLTGSSISSNRAAFCGGLLLDTPAGDASIHASRVEDNSAGEQQSSSRQLLATASFGQLPQWNRTGSGGGMCIVPGGTVSVTKSIVTNNSALYGGGMFVQDCVSRRGQPTTDSLKASVKSGSSPGLCRVMVGSQTVISGNEEQDGGSGSALYTTDTAAVRVTPGARAGKVNNASSNAARSPDSVASKPATVLGGFQQQSSRQQQQIIGLPGSRSNVLLVESGSALPAVRLQLVDQLGQQLPASLLQQLTFRAQATAVTNSSQSDTNLLGVTSVVPAANSSSRSSNVDFQMLELQGAPGATFNVSFAVLEAPEVSPAVVQVQLRHCRPGQAVLRGRGTDLYAGCSNCTNPLFSFDPAAPQCSACPPPETYSTCSGDIITPANGFWQSHPRSAQLLECPNPAACTRGKEVADQLAAASAAMTPNASAVKGSSASRGLRAVSSGSGADQTLSDYQQLQCAEGFTGNLCSNCDRNSRVTQSYAHTCRACSVNRAGSFVLFFLIRLLDLSIVLLSVALVLRERQRRNKIANSTAVTPASIRVAMQQGIPLALPTGHKAPLEVIPFADQQGALQAGSVQADAYLMMFIEFMQLLSIFRLTRIGTIWRSTAEAVLMAISITPISSYSWMSLECILRPGLAPQRYAYYSTLASTYIPVILVAVVCGIVLSRTLMRAKRMGFRRLLSFPPLVPELLLAAAKAVAYGYPVVTGSVLGLFSCKQLDQTPRVAGEVAAAQGNFWNRDLDTACFQGSHLTYALAVGLPMLLLVVLYPLVTSLLLTRQARKQPDGLCEVSFWANYSMLYQDYTPSMYLWGSIRDLRQLLLIAVVVVLQAYPVQLQMMGGWLLSLALLGSHAALWPFRTGLLNGLQTAMLAAISFTFYAAVLSTVTGISSATTAVLQVVAVVVNVVVAFVLLGVLLWRMSLWLDHDKDGHVSWTDIKNTFKHHGGATASAAKGVYKKIGSLAPLRSNSSNILAHVDSNATGQTGMLSPAASSNLIALSSVNTSDCLSPTTSQALSGYTSGSTLPLSSSSAGSTLPPSSSSAGVSSTLYGLSTSSAGGVRPSDSGARTPRDPTPPPPPPPPAN